MGRGCRRSKGQNGERASSFAFSADERVFKRRRFFPSSYPKARANISCFSQSRGHFLPEREGTVLGKGALIELLLFLPLSSLNSGIFSLFNNQNVYYEIDILHLLSLQRVLSIIHYISRAGEMEKTLFSTANPRVHIAVFCTRLRLGSNNSPAL